MFIRPLTKGEREFRNMEGQLPKCRDCGKGEPKKKLFKATESMRRSWTTCKTCAEATAANKRPAVRRGEMRYSMGQIIPKKTG